MVADRVILGAREVVPPFALPVLSAQRLSGLVVLASGC